jgi:DNA-binding beta-propeller fold protein YncE
VDASGNVTNAEDFTVEQSIDVSSTTCPAPQPMGVAVDPVQGNAGIAAVSLFGCSQLALIDIATSTVTVVKVGSNPIGVAVLPRLGLAVVANNGSNNAYIVHESNGQTTPQSPVATGTSPTGAAADEETGEVAIANSVTNTVSVVNAQNGAVHSITTGAGPVAVGFNYVNHQVAVAAFGSSSLAIADGSASSTTAVATINAPTSVVYDPVPADCGSSASSTPNTVGCFLANSSTDDLVYIIDPVAGGIQSAFKVGVNPTAIAYNFLTSTVVSTNTSSHTVTVADFLAHQIRAVLPLPPIAPANSNFATNLGIAGVPLYALDVHPFLNIAVIADTANGAVLFIPLPR